MSCKFPMIRRIIRKQLWFRLGNETSQRQWRDVVGVLKAMSGRLDFDYLCEGRPRRSIFCLFSTALQPGGIKM